MEGWGALLEELNHTEAKGEATTPVKGGAQWGWSASLIEPGPNPATAGSTESDQWTASVPLTPTVGEDKVFSGPTPQFLSLLCMATSGRQDVIAASFTKLMSLVPAGLAGDVDTFLDTLNNLTDEGVDDLIKQDAGFRCTLTMTPGSVVYIPPGWHLWQQNGGSGATSDCKDITCFECHGLVRGILSPSSMQQMVKYVACMGKSANLGRAQAADIAWATGRHGTGHPCQSMLKFTQSGREGRPQLIS